MSLPEPARTSPPAKEDAREELRARLAVAFMLATAFEAQSRLAAGVDPELARRVRECHGQALESMGRLRHELRETDRKRREAGE